MPARFWWITSEMQCFPPLVSLQAVHKWKTLWIHYFLDSYGYHPPVLDGFERHLESKVLDVSVGYFCPHLFLKIKFLTFAHCFGLRGNSSSHKNFVIYQGNTMIIDSIVDHWLYFLEQTRHQIHSITDSSSITHAGNQWLTLTAYKVHLLGIYLQEFGYSCRWCWFTELFTPLLFTFAHLFDK